jgi:hypothetical protein
VRCACAWRTLVVFLSLCLLLGRASAEIVVFDMGSPDSAVWPGARPVTPDDSGWHSRQGLSVHHGVGTGDLQWTNAFTEDTILGRGANNFRFSAAAGPWSVYVLSGVGAKWNQPVAEFWDFTVTVGLEGWHCQIMSPTDSLGPYRLEHHVFSVVSDGTIQVGLDPRSAWCLTGVIAWQTQDEAAARTLIQTIEQWAPDADRAKWTEAPRPPAGPEPDLSAADRRRGFSIWHRHWATPIYPWTNPAEGETDPTLRAFAAPGEYEPLTFTVRPLRDLARVEVTVGDLGPVPPEQIEIRKVRFLEARVGISTDGEYCIVPDVLDRWEPGPLKVGENATFWLTVHVPEGARPGIHRGAVRLVADGQTADVPVVLRVLDVRLEEDPNHISGIYYTDPLDRLGSAADEWTRKHLGRQSELQHADMAAHGLRNITLDCSIGVADESGAFLEAPAAFARLAGRLEMARRHGFVGPFMLTTSSYEIYRKHVGSGLGSHGRGVKMPPEEYFSEVTQMVRTIEAERQRRGWPEFVYLPFDEPAPDPDTIAFMVRLLQAYKAAGVRTYMTAAPEKAGYEAMMPYVDVWCTQTFLPDYDTVTADMAARGVKYWCYPNDISGECDHTPVAGARMTFGFGFWRSGFVRLLPWIYQWELGGPFNYLDSGSMDVMIRNEPDGTPIPVALWEAYREGADDMRYIYSLQQAVGRGRGSEREAVRREAEEAQRTLDEVWASVPVLPQYQYRGFWSPEEMDARRWMVAERLERLTKLMR